MLNKLNRLLAGLPMTLVAGAFLLLDLWPHLTGGGPPPFLPFDPAWVTVVVCGVPLVWLALERVVRNRGISKISSALLISIAMFAAIAIGDLFAAGEVAFIMAIGALLEEATTNRAKKGLRQLMDLAPVRGRRLTGEGEETIPAEQIRPGDLLRVLPGETIPADGTVVTGQTSVDQSILTGESLPVEKGPGDPVFCGTINRFGSMDIRAQKVGEDSSLRTLIRMVEQAEEQQAPMQRIADRAASWLVPAALLIALLAFAGTGNVVTAVTVLVVFCPCALVLATPTAVMAAIGHAARHGVIIKSGQALEQMDRVDVVALDKTGTLTWGRLEVCDILPLAPGLEEEDLLALAAAAESRSEHPLGRAVVACARARHIPLPPSEGFCMTAGRGIVARVGERTLHLGSEAYLGEQGVVLEGQAAAALERLRSQGKAVILAAEGAHCLGLIALSDVLRPQAGEMAARLAHLGVDTVLLTGDHRTAARYFAQQAGITQVHAQLLPGEKVARIRALQGEGHRVCMVGDGINDAPALKTADVSVAMGHMGSHIAVDAADIALMGDDLSRLPYLKRLSDATVRTIKVGITLSMCINFVAILLSLLGVLNPTTGALVHNGGSCLVVLLAADLGRRLPSP